MELGGGIRQSTLFPAALGSLLLGHGQGDIGVLGSRQRGEHLGSGVMHMPPTYLSVPFAGGPDAVAPTLWEFPVWERAGGSECSLMGREGTPIFSAWHNSSGCWCWPRTGLILWGTQHLPP